MTVSPPLVYIILVTWNHWAATEECLAKLVKMDYPNYRIVLVDNDSTDGTPERVETLYSSVVVLRNERNLGFAAGCNTGLRYSLRQGTEFLLILNNDTIAPADFVSRLVASAGTLPTAGVLTPIARHAEDPDRLWPTAGFRHRLTNDYVELRPDQLRTDHPLSADYVFGTAMFVRREVFERVGLFDERFFMYYEDMDFCLRAGDAGFQLYIIPDLCILHRAETSTREWPERRQYFKARSSVLFFQTHSSGFQRPIIAVYRFGSALKRLARLVWHNQSDQAHGYLRGLLDGLRHGSQGYAESPL
jgi:GT2 family glycosyltransferase